MKELKDIELYKKVLLGVLKEIDSFCKENNINYFLTGGTLIGAIRHKGFIPWDDDIDVGMLRRDYEIFINKYVPSKDCFRLLSLETSKKYCYPFSKLIDNRYLLYENVSSSIQLGPYVDIFPVDCCPGNDFKSACKSIDRLRLLRYLWLFKTIRFSKHRSFIKNMILFFGKIISLPFSRRRLACMISKRAKKHSNTNCKYVGGLVNTTYGYGEIFLSEWFEQTTDVIFEGSSFKAPFYYHEFLTSLYGDYLTMPPPEKRKTHHDFKCYFKE